jgi:hypothetical protein
MSFDGDTIHVLPRQLCAKQTTIDSDYVDKGGEQDDTGSQHQDFVRLESGD